jgi:hypothetical protein
MSQVKVTVYEAKETIVNVQFPICFRSTDSTESVREYYRFTDEKTLTKVLPYFPAIRTTEDAKNAIELQDAYNNCVQIQDEIFEAKLEQTMASIHLAYHTVKADIERKYDTEAQKEYDQEKTDADALDNHRNH